MESLRLARLQHRISYIIGLSKTVPNAINTTNRHYSSFFTKLKRRPHHYQVSSYPATSTQYSSFLYKNTYSYDPGIMNTSVELVSVPCADTPGTCIYMHTEKQSYIFGRVGEGTQRAFGMRKTTMGRVEQIFLSGPVGWEQLGGLPGFLLSIGSSVEAVKQARELKNSERQAKGQKSLGTTTHQGVRVHGADNLSYLLATIRPVIFRQPVSVHVEEHRTDKRVSDPENLDPDWSDECIQVWKIPTRRSRSSTRPSKRRRHSDAGSEMDAEAAATPATDESSTKTTTTTSGSEIARHIVERVMFNGSLKTNPVLAPKEIGKLTEKDVAVIIENGAIQLYTGPYSSEETELPNADDVAFVFSDGETIIGAGNEEGKFKSLQINHSPLPPTIYSENSMSYIIKSHGRRGKFNAPKAKELGVQQMQYRDLIAGESVTTGTGAVVTPEMVLGEPIPGQGMVVADIPSLDFLDAFLQRPEWANGKLMEHVVVMYWILGDGLAEDARISTFIQQRPNIRHVLCNKDTCPNMISYSGATEMLMRLRRVDPDRFPILQYENSVKYPAPAPDSSIELGRAGAKLALMPRLVFDDASKAPFPNLVAAFNDVHPDAIALADKAKAETSDAEFLERVAREEQDIPNRDAEIICLGTGSSTPSKYRNVSSTLVRVPGIGSYLFDCGEGTLGQITRLYGEEGAVEVLRDLKCIVISHLHADHHLGTCNFIRAWYEQALKDGSNAKLAISCISRYRMLLEEVAQVEDIGFHRLRFPSCTDTKDDLDITTREHLGTENFGLAGIKRVSVPHCWRSYATEIELTSGLRIAYSGDCRPSSKFAQICQGTHLLIHECTFGDDLQSHAKAKMHSTLSEALQVAKEMGARRTLLTHFSQRYIKEKSNGLYSANIDKNSVMFGFDFMKLKLGDFQIATRFVPAIELLMEKLMD